MPDIADLQPPSPVDWRNPLCDSLLKGVVWGGMPIVMGLLATIWLHEEHQLLDWAPALGVFGIMTTAHAIRTISPRAKAIITAAGLNLMGWLAVMNLGMDTGPIVTSFIGLVAVALLFGRRAAVPVLVASSALMGIMGAHPPDVVTPGALTALGFAGTSVAGLLLIIHLVVQLERQLIEQMESYRALQQEQRQREQAEANLQSTRVQLEDARRFQAMGRVTTGVAHEFNNILQVLLSWTEIFDLASSPEEQAEAMVEIRAATLSAGQITKELLSIGQRNADKTRAISLHEHIHDWARSWENMMPEDIQLTVEASPVELCLVNEGRMQQALLNLVTNASHESVGSTHVQIKVTSLAGSALPVQILVSDDGCGITPEDIERIFEPFFTSKKQDGTGLGLSIIRGTIEQYAGTINVRSRVGVGTEFDIRLPEHILEPAPETSPTQETRPTRLPSRAGPKRILVVEDEPILRRTIVTMLRQRGDYCEDAEDGDRAMERLEQSATLDLLCIDAHMPGASPIDVIRKFRATQPDGNVLICTGDIRDPGLLDYAAAEQIPILIKPFSRDELYSHIGTL